MGETPNQLYRFGVFEADRETGELRKQGRRLPLQGQPFEILLMLLERPGELIPRTQIRERLWPEGTFVDFDHSLNTAVNKIREVLGDSASSPRFVETLARRGYRFIAPVNGIDLMAPPSPRAAVISTPFTEAERPIDPELHVPQPHRGVVRSLFGLVQVMYLAFYISA